jgi:hypothetical protein
MRMPAQSESAQAPRWLLAAGASAGSVLFAAFLLGFLPFLGQPTAVGNNWLVTLFNLNFRPLSTHTSALSTFSLLDTTLMLLFGLLMASMYPILGSTSRTWALIAAALPFIGAPVFLVTATAGRSAVLLAALISSVLAYRCAFGAPATAVAGILASATLLFLGDFATAAFAPSLLIAALIAAGYVLWTAWLLLVALELARSARSAAG